jgi:hypothetical protein
MSAEEFRRRLRKLEAELAKLNPDPSTDDELIAALKAFTATPIQMEQIWAIAREDIRTQIIRLARNRRLFYAAGGWYESAVTLPVTRAIEILSHRADEPFELSLEYAPRPIPHGSSIESSTNPNRRHAPLTFTTWARTALMTKLLGDDGGLCLRHEIDDWMDGGDAPLMWTGTPRKEFTGYFFPSTAIRLSCSMRGYCACPMPSSFGESETTHAGRHRSPGMILTVDICGHRWTVRGSRDCDRAWAKSPSQLPLALIWALWRLGTLTCGDSHGATPVPLVREFREHPTKSTLVNGLFGFWRGAAASEITQN